MRHREREREGEGEKPSSDGWMDVILTVAIATQCPKKARVKRSRVKKE
jgi:hypothetical protein